VAAALAALAAVAYTTYRAFEAIHNETQRIQGYDQDLSQAHANSELRAELADIRRAQRLGPDGAKVEDMRSRVMEKVADIGTEIYGEVAELLVKLEPLIDFLINVLGLTADSIPAIIDKLTAIAEFVSLNPALIADALKEDPAEKRNRQRMEKAVTDFMEGKKSEPDAMEDPFMIGLLQQFGATKAAREAARKGRAGKGKPAPGKPKAPAGFGGP
jgi:hypothetical protein